MKREEIMALEAGPETDALVAKALGVAPVRRWAGSSDDYQMYPLYSTRISAAYEAQEALSPPHQREFGNILGNISRGGLGLTVYWRMASATPLRRCKAILLTLSMD